MKPNPIGKVRAGILDEQVNEIVGLWQEDNPEPPKWWEFWKRLTGQWYAAVRYIIASVDYFVRVIDDLLESGADKKASVLESLGQVYDSIVPFLLPIFLRPFNTQIKSFVINVIASLMIDFIVGKYREGIWREKEETTPESPLESPESPENDEETVPAIGLAPSPRYVL